MLAKSVSFNSAALTVFAIVTAGALALTHTHTKEKIEIQEKLAAAKALLEIIPKHKHNNSMLDTVWTMRKQDIKALNLKKDSVIYIAKKDAIPVGVIIPTMATDGYSGNISMLVGIYVHDNTLAGVRVVQHKETPGLGDKIDLRKSDWILSFDNKSLSNPRVAEWKVKKDGGVFDQFTGATITPRAMVNQIKETMLFFERNKSRIIQAPQ